MVHLIVTLKTTNYHSASGQYFIFCINQMSAAVILPGHITQIEPSSLSWKLLEEERKFGSIILNYMSRALGRLFSSGHVRSDRI